MDSINGMNILGLGSLVTADASTAREPSNPVVTLSPEELAKRIKAQKRAKARAERKAAEKIAGEIGIYQVMVYRGVAAVRATETEAQAWKALAGAVLDVYGANGAERFEETRDQFTIDCLVPGLDDQTKIEGLEYTRRGLMMLDMPHARSKDSHSFPNFAATRKAKDDLARYVKSKLWKRVLDYAYPPVEATDTTEAADTTESADTGETVEGLTLAKYTAAIGTLLKQLQASSGIDGLNIAKASEALTVALTAATTK